MDDDLPEKAEPVPVNHRFDARVSLEADEVRQAFKSDPNVAWYENADPPAFGLPGAPAFEAWPDGPNTVVVRRHVPASMHLASPYVVIELAPVASGGAEVRARFVRRAPGTQISQRARSAIFVACVFTLVMMVVYLAVMPLMLLHPSMWLTIGAAIGGMVILSRYSRNRPSPESMQHFGGPLWGLVGAKLVPHVLGEGEDPFRLKALGGRR